MKNNDFSIVKGQVAENRDFSGAFSFKVEIWT